MPHRRGLTDDRPSTAALRREQRFQDEAREARRRGGYGRTSGHINDLINADPKEAERLRRARQGVREGKVLWGLDDDEEASKTSDDGA